MLDACPAIIREGSRNGGHPSMRSERTFNAAIRRDPSYSLARTKLIKARLRSLQCNYRGEADRLFSADVSAKNSKLSSTGTDLITYNTAVGLVKLPRMPREKSVAGKILLNELSPREQEEEGGVKLHLFLLLGERKRDRGSSSRGHEEVGKKRLQMASFRWLDRASPRIER